MVESTSDTIATNRLLLTAPRLEDAADIYTYSQNPNVLRYTTGTPPREFAETEAFVRELMDRPTGAYSWSIRLKKQAEVIGIVEFGIQDDNSGAVDYALAEKYWNRGIMTETVDAIFSWAFDALPALEIIFSSAMTANPASTRVQQKCGMKLIGHEWQNWPKCDAPVELVMYAITRSEWYSRKARVKARG